MFIESCTRMGCYRYATTACSVCHLPYCFWHLQSVITAPGIHNLLCETCLRQIDPAWDGLSFSSLSQSVIRPEWDERTDTDGSNPLMRFDLPLDREEGISDYDSHSHR
jgi:hypothetical protein